jgi:cytochrome b561
MESYSRYTRTAVLLHWLIAVLIIGNVLLAWVTEGLPDPMVRPAVDLPKSIGLTVLGLALLRVLWRWTHKPPPLPDSYPRLERLGAHTAHLLLYGLMLALPISGWIHDSAFKDAAQHPLTLFWTVPWFRIGAIQALPPEVKEPFHSAWFQIHTALGYALYGLLALHVLGALKHEFVNRQPEFGRILHWRPTRPAQAKQRTG